MVTVCDLTGSLSLKCFLCSSIVQSKRHCPKEHLPCSNVLLVLGKLEASPFPCPHPPYSPSTNPDPNYLPWHGHVTALTISPIARRLGYATKLTEAMERASDAADAWFVDLFVRKENTVAQKLYNGMGYSVYRRVSQYYNDRTDAFDMRKPLRRDVKRETVREGGEDIVVDPRDVW